MQRGLLEAQEDNRKDNKKNSICKIREMKQEKWLLWLLKKRIIKSVLSVPCRAEKGVRVFLGKRHSTWETWRDMYSVGVSVCVCMCVCHAAKSIFVLSE